MHLALKAAALAGTIAFGATEAAGVAVHQFDLNVDLEKIVAWGTILGMFAGAIFYVERRIKTHLADHTETEDEKAEIRHKEIKQEVKAARNEHRESIRHLRELLAFAGAVPDHTPAPIRIVVDDLPPDPDTEPTPGG